MARDLSWMKEEGNKLLFVGEGECIYYVPNYYFTSALNTEVIGEYVNLFGVFQYVYIHPNGKADEPRPFKFPTIFKCKPSKIEKITNFHLENTRGEEDYKLLRFTKGSELVSELAVPHSAIIVQSFIDLLNGSHLPNYIPYTEIIEYIINCAKLNGFNFKVNNQILAMLVSELYRDAENQELPFRLAKTNNMRAYKAIRIEQVPRVVSVYTSITAENPSQALSAAITNKRDTPHNPLERIVMN